MAERRMFAKTIIDSDAFLDMPATTQLLYFHLSMRADDDGFVNKPKAIMRTIGCKEDDMKLLFAKKFLIPFESGVVVIKHWKIHNYIRKDTYTETKYKEEKSTLVMDENNAYRIAENSALQIRDEHVTESSTQDRLGKDSLELDKDSIDTEPKETLASVLGNYTDNLDLKSALLDYVEMRKKTKGFTVRALKLNLTELDKLALDDDTKIDIVNQSIMHSWKGFYQLKGNQVQQKQEGNRAF